MLSDFRYKIAVFIAPSLDEEVRQRALKLAPKVWLGEYQCQFYGLTETPEDGLSNDEKKQYQVWAKTNTLNPWFRHFIRWVINTQANYAIRHAQNERQADFARATINAAELIEDGVDRLAAIFDKEQKDSQPVEFDKNITGISELD